MLDSILDSGDWIETTTGKKGKIVTFEDKMQTNMQNNAVFQFQDREYAVVWTHFPNAVYTYWHSEVKQEWTKTDGPKGTVQVRSQLDNHAVDALRYHFNQIQENIKKSVQCPIVAGYDRGFEITMKECQHEWADYVGFSERYKYCRKCDEKRNID